MAFEVVAHRKRVGRAATLVSVLGGWSGRGLLRRNVQCGEQRSECVGRTLQIARVRTHDPAVAPALFKTIS